MTTKLLEQLPRPQKMAFVLLSGGMDSTTCLYQAMADYGNVEAISVYYGQRHAKEMDYAKASCDELGVKHSVLNMKGILDGGGVMLTDANVEIPDISYDEIKGVSPTYVPFRNGTLLSVITALAQKYVMSQIAWLKTTMQNFEHLQTEPSAYYNDEFYSNLCKDLVGVYFGAHSEDAHNWAYPDCTPEFIGSMANAIYVGTYYSVRLHTPLMWSSKTDVVRLGDRLGVNWENTWSCYKGETLQCGICPTCRSRRGAFEAAGVEDPTTYAN